MRRRLWADRNEWKTSIEALDLPAIRPTIRVYRIERSRISLNGGARLGFAIVQRIAEAHGGIDIAGAPRRDQPSAPDALPVALASAEPPSIPAIGPRNG